MQINVSTANINTLYRPITSIMNITKVQILHVYNYVLNYLQIHFYL